MDDIVIEKHVPPPQAGHGSWGSVLARMEVGDSFVTDDDKHARAAMRVAASRLNVHLTIRKEVDAEGKPVVGKMRAWRITKEDKEQA
jgi:hypothetical protein